MARPAEPPAPPTPHALQSARSSVVAPRSPSRRLTAPRAVHHTRHPRRNSFDQLSSRPTGPTASDLFDTRNHLSAFSPYSTFYGFKRNSYTARNSYHFLLRGPPKCEKRNRISKGSSNPTGNATRPGPCVRRGTRDAEHATRNGRCSIIKVKFHLASVQRILCACGCRHLSAEVVQQARVCGPPPSFHRNGR